MWNNVYSWSNEGCFRHWELRARKLISLGRSPRRFLTIKPSDDQTFTKDNQQQDCSSTTICVKQLKHVHTTLKNNVNVVPSILIVYSQMHGLITMYCQLARKRESYIYILHFFVIKSWRCSVSKRFKNDNWMLKTDKHCQFFLNISVLYPEFSL